MGKQQQEALVRHEPRAARRPRSLASVVQVTLLAAALWDISHRPAAGIKGSKKAWTAASFVNFVGPIAYFVFGRKRAEA